MDSPKKNAVYWIILPVGIVVILGAVYLVGSVLKGRMTKPASTPTSPAQVILDEKGSDQERADRISLGEAGSRVADEEAKREKDKKDKEKTDQERAKVEVEQTDSAAEHGAADISTSADDEKKKAVITTEPEDGGPGEGGVTAAEVTKPGAAAAKDGMIYRLQLGAFDDEERARKVAAEVRADTGLNIIVGKKTVDGKIKYRLQGGAFADKEKAQSYARELELKGLTVYVSEEKK